MDPQAQVALISGVVALVLGTLTYVGARKRPGLTPSHDEPTDPTAVVQKIAEQGIDGLTPHQVSLAVTALAQTITVLQSEVGALKRKELAYLRRLAVVEHIAVYSTDPPPRALPPWTDEPHEDGV